LWAAWTASRGLGKWHVETVGKRRTELAEDVLSSFYQMRDIIGEIRSPPPGDLLPFVVQVHRDESDSGTLKRMKDAYNEPIARYNEHRKLIADLIVCPLDQRAGEEISEPEREGQRFQICHYLVSLKNFQVHQLLNGDRIREYA
jgi:hypothetical protein